MDSETIEIEKAELELRVSQLATQLVNDEVELRLKPIRQSIKINAFIVSAFFVASVALWFFNDSYFIFSNLADIAFMFFVWMYPVWSHARFRPRWIDAHWVSLELFDKEKNDEDTRRDNVADKRTSG